MLFRGTLSGINLLKDISFCVAPPEKRNASEIIQKIKGRKILDSNRGMDVAALNILADILVASGKIGLENENIKEIDINPLILSSGKPVAVDALVVLGV